MCPIVERAGTAPTRFGAVSTTVQGSSSAVEILTIFFSFYRSLQPRPPPARACAWRYSGKPVVSSAPSHMPSRPCLEFLSRLVFSTPVARLNSSFFFCFSCSGFRVFGAESDKNIEFAGSRPHDLRCRLFCHRIANPNRALYPLAPSWLDRLRQHHCRRRVAGSNLTFYDCSCCPNLCLGLERARCVSKRNLTKSTDWLVGPRCVTICEGWAPGRHVLIHPRSVETCCRCRCFYATYNKMRGVVRIYRPL